MLKLLTVKPTTQPQTLYTVYNKKYILYKFGLFGWWPKLATPNFRQIVAVRESLTSKIKATLVAKFGKKIGLWHVGQGAKKVWHAVVVTANQTAAKKIMTWLTCSMAHFGHEPNKP
jgi:hypothetical protein